MQTPAFQSPIDRISKIDLTSSFNRQEHIVAHFFSQPIRMQGVDVAGETLVSRAHDGEHSTIVIALATACLVWYIAVVLVCIIGYSQV